MTMPSLMALAASAAFHQMDGVGVDLTAARPGLADRQHHRGTKPGIGLPAEYGISRASFNIVTKSGGNEFSAILSRSTRLRRASVDEQQQRVRHGLPPLPPIESL
jgi:hypothetical protein